MKSLKLSRKVIYGGLALVAVLGFWFTREQDPGSAPARQQRATATAARTTGADAFTEEDYSARFPRLEGVEVRNVFQPGVVRSGLSGAIGSDDPHMIPPEFAHGETNWIYTGTATIDGVPVALIENASSGDGVFLKHGEQWKAARIMRITPDQIVLAGPGGATRTVKVHHGSSGLSGSLATGPLNPGPAVERAMADGVFITPERPRGGFPMITEDDDE